jgi:hypothetical protein
MKSLRVLVEEGQLLIEDDQELVEPPPHEARSQPWGVVYVHPNPDGSRKACRNCIMWVAGQDRRVVHEKNLPITAEHVCGYHVYGKPMRRWTDHPGIDPLDPNLSGLDMVPGGTSCDICREYLPAPRVFPAAEEGVVMGRCQVVIDQNRMPAPVDPLGCCARWVRA